MNEDHANEVNFTIGEFRIPLVNDRLVSRASGHEMANVEMAGAARFYRAASSNQRERDRPLGWASLGRTWEHSLQSQRNDEWKLNFSPLCA